MRQSTVTFLCLGGDLKVLHGEVLNGQDSLVGLVLPVQVLLLQALNPAGAQIVILYGDLRDRQQTQGRVNYWTTQTFFSV